MAMLHAVGWSAAACAIFGLQNYLLGYTNSLAGDDLARTIGLLWLGAGICGLLVLASNPSRGIFFMDTSYLASLSARLLSSVPTEIPMFPKIVTLAGGLTIGGAQLLMKLSFAEDPPAQGPLCSVICADVILVSIICHFFYSEILNVGQWLSVVLVFSGLVTMSGIASNDGVTPMSFFLAICSMLCFGASVLSVRVAAIAGLAASSGFIARTIIMGIASTPLLFTADWSVGSVQGIGIPLLCGLLQASGVYSINEALTVGPYTSISIAIFGSNSVIVLALSMLIEAQVPTANELIGMALTVTGCAAVSLLARDEGGTHQTTQAVASSPLRRKKTPIQQ